MSGPGAATRPPGRGRPQGSTRPHLLRRRSKTHAGVPIPESLQFQVNALAPNGSSFSSAEVVIYAKAIYKPRHPEATSLEYLIETDKHEYGLHVPGVKVREFESLATSDGQKLRSLEFTPTQGGEWDWISYGEEGDFYLIFTLSAQSQSAYRKAIPVYRQVVEAYREGSRSVDLPALTGRLSRP